MRQARMFNQTKRLASKEEKELREAILRDKAKGVPDYEIGQKYGVGFRYIERVITQAEGVNVSSLRTSKTVKKIEPVGFREQQTTIWSFKRRGDWATHSGEYRGNWSPYIPRNVILKYSQPGELVLDYFCGAGTTAIESKLLGRKCIGLDINDRAIELAKENLDFEVKKNQLSLTVKRDETPIYEPELLVGDARDLSFLLDDSVDLICAHPPYADIIHYTDSKQGDLSFLERDEFLREMATVAQESFRVLKPGRQCAILIGDMRKKKRVVPLGFRLINVYLNAGFKLRELIIKRQHNCKTTGFWYSKSLKYNFLLLAHEYLPIFEKPNTQGKQITSKRFSSRELGFSYDEKPKPNKEIGGAETTTVWISVKKDFQTHITFNIVNRYCRGSNYLSLIPRLLPKRQLRQLAHEVGLLLVDFSSMEDFTLDDLESCLVRTLDVIQENFNKVSDGGFVVFQVKDLRWGKYIESVAKRVVDRILNENLKLKEIIIFVMEDNDERSELMKSEYLKVTHQYGIVYEVVK